MSRVVFPPCYLTWSQTMVEVMNTMVTSFKRSHACPQPCSRPPLTHASSRDAWTLIGKSGSVSCGVTAPFSWVFVHLRLCLCHPRVCFQSCVSSGSSMVGLMATSSKRAYAVPRSAAPRAPAPAAIHCWPVPPQETLTVLSQSLLGIWVLVRTRVVWALWASLACMEFDSKCVFAPPTILLELLLCPWTWGISSKSFQHRAATTPAPHSCHSRAVQPL